MAELIVAAATPLTDDGRRLDETAIWPMATFLAAHGADGIFALGTTGEGMLLTEKERQRAAVVFRAACRRRLIVHCGAQSTDGTVRLAAHAAEIGADAIAVIAPPYFPLDATALEAHFVAAARACDPLPFYLYAFAPRSGYPLPVDVVQRVRERAPNVAGLKVSESPWERVAPYLELGLPVYVGSEPLIPRGLAAGAVGAVSGMAAAFPDIVRRVIDRPDEDGEELLARLRQALERGPFIASVKHALGQRGVPLEPDVRHPLRALSAEEERQLDAALQELAAPIG